MTQPHDRRYSDTEIHALYREVEQTNVAINLLKNEMTKMTEIYHMQCGFHMERTTVLDTVVKRLDAIINGEGDDEGLNEKVRGLIKYQQKGEKMQWFIFTAVAGLVVKVGIDLAIKLIQKL